VSERFGPYELAELLGRGGMGEVWRATDTRKARTVALKRLPAEMTGEREFEDRFRREAHAAARLTDPHVIPIHDYGEIDGRLYLDMRLVHGRDLGAVIDAEGALRVPRAVSVLEQVASALDAAHDDGLVHRDVKPSNILLTPSKRTVDPDDFVYLIDFGIATGAALGTRLTRTGLAVGTAAYMAPERFTDGVDADPRIDVYALGCVLHEALTGRPPFPGRDVASLMYQHLNTIPTPPSRVTTGLPAGLDDVVATALAKNPVERYARAGQMAEDARRALSRTPAASQRRVETQLGPAPSAPGPAPARPPTSQGPPSFLQPWHPGPVRDTPPPPPMAYPAPPPPAPKGRLVAAIAALPVAALLGLVALIGTIAELGTCSTRSAACGSGTTALLATVVTGVGGALAIAGLTTGGRRTAWRAGAAWVVLGVGFVLLVIAIALDP
jgi:serine/threonine protein kinase